MIFSEKNTAWDFYETTPEIAILPLACFEPHSPHLPLGTDMFLMSAIGKAVAERMAEDTFLMPVWPYGTSGHHAGETGVMYLEFETLWHIVRDIAVSLNEHGIHKVVVLNNHGSPMATTIKPIGNFVVKTAVRQLNYEVPGISAIWVQPFAAGRMRLIELFESAANELHVGAVERSLLMHLLPDEVWETPTDFAPEVRTAFLDYRRFAKFSPQGVWGKPSEATREKGSEVMDIVVEETAEYIRVTYEKLRQLAENNG